jgi:hypothetical protein
MTARPGGLVVVDDREQDEFRLQGMDQGARPP